MPPPPRRGDSLAGKEFFLDPAGKFLEKNKSLAPRQGILALPAGNFAPLQGIRRKYQGTRGIRRTTAGIFSIREQHRNFRLRVQPAGEYRSLDYNIVTPGLGRRPGTTPVCYI